MPASKLRKRLGLLALAVLVPTLAISGWLAFEYFFPNLFDRERVDAGELDRLKSADLSRKVEASADWPQFRGAGRDGFAPAGPMRFDWGRSPPKVKWSVPLGGGYSSFAVVGNTAYTMDRTANNERIVALDTESGKTEWIHEYAADYSVMKMGYGEGPRATPTVHDGRLYAVGATGKLLCLELPSKPEDKPKPLWEKELVSEFNASIAEWGMACSPLIEGDLVIVLPGGRKGSVAAFDRVSGGLKWATGKEPNGYSSPVAATLGGIRQIVSVMGTSILGVRASDGELLWKHPFETSYKANIAMPVIVGDYVFVSSGYNKGCVCLHVTGKDADVVYFKPKKLMRTHHSTCVHKDGFLYGFDEDKLKCVNLREGTEVEDWPDESSHKDLAKGSLILVSDHLIGLTQTGTLFCAKADPKEWTLTGMIKGVLKGSQCWALPVAVNGRIYLRDGEKAVCLESGASVSP
jgi:outer membrane protein assembly factor BamB